MRKIILLLAAFALLTGLSCKKEQKDPEPGYILQKWSKAIEKSDYINYSRCEAYPKSEYVFKEIYRDDYFTDIMVVDIEEPDMKKINKDYEGNSYIQRNVTFEGYAVKRTTGKPYQIIRGDAIFRKFTDGKRIKDGWLLSNRTITRINK